MKAWLSERNLAYIIRDIAVDSTALDELERLGHMTTPVTVIDGEVVVGFDRARLEELTGGSGG